LSLRCRKLHPLSRIPDSSLRRVRWLNEPVSSRLMKCWGLNGIAFTAAAKIADTACGRQSGSKLQLGDERFTTPVHWCRGSRNCFRVEGGRWESGPMGTRSLCFPLSHSLTCSLSTGKFKASSPRLPGSGL
jgi:hypothetical protein